MHEINENLIQQFIMRLGGRGHIRTTFKQFCFCFPTYLFFTPEMLPINLFNLSDKTPCETMWFHCYRRMKISGNSSPTVRGQILCQNKQAQAYFCGATPRTGTVGGTVRPSPAFERTAFLWKCTTNRV
jgi:hypothetical protein